MNWDEAASDSDPVGWCSAGWNSIGLSEYLYYEEKRLRAVIQIILTQHEIPTKPGMFLWWVFQFSFFLISYSNTAGAISQWDASFEGMLSGSTKTGVCGPLPCLLLALWQVAMCFVAFPWKVSSGRRSKRRPCGPSFAMLKWSCHLKAPSHQLTDQMIQYWHHNCHLKASKQGAFLFTCWPWHHHGLTRVASQASL